MAKDSSFAAKVAKASAGDKGLHCGECGEVYQMVKLVTSVRSPVKDSWRFTDNLVRVCNCNQAEIYG
jgi:hypothetical protein